MSVAAAVDVPGEVVMSGSVSPSLAECEPASVVIAVATVGAVGSVGEELLASTLVVEVPEDEGSVSVIASSPRPHPASVDASVAAATPRRRIIHVL